MRKAGLARKPYGYKPGEDFVSSSTMRSQSHAPRTLCVSSCPEAVSAASALLSKSSWRPALRLRSTGTLGQLSPSEKSRPRSCQLIQGAPKASRHLRKLIIFCFIPHLWWNFFPGRRAVRINSLTFVKYRYYCTKCIAKAHEMIVNYKFSAML